MIRDLISEYNKKKRSIKKRLKEFRTVWSGSDKRVFSELCFCICTPQSKAVYCDKAVSGLEESDILFKGRLRQIKAGLRAVRFPNNKARYIIKARELFSAGGDIRIKDKIDVNNITQTRKWLAQKVAGIGFKEASHFLRNIGFGKDLAILDIHILKNIAKYGIIKEIPKTISKSKYLLLEDKVRIFSVKVNIPMDELDLLFWSNQTGFVFK
ncbi:MAG: N-glycosylase/DNA lyase [Candidatus Omnitrophota bacterium]|nr:N-glycosylase/DNA lyase [Candidatus Omnitrophota bacterium]